MIRGTRFSDGDSGQIILERSSIEVILRFTTRCLPEGRGFFKSIPKVFYFFISGSS
jgi:hypothetical protein